ncbi:MAG: flagellar hook-basal body complex protein, partial [Oscillospiraceae bacterium]|nr:flagellar hook-basal body complex protein [Oscillospiraceae bacterium]
ADGNIMYTKAGMLDIDADGNLVDVNGNFVLGVSGSDTSLPPASNKIKIDLPYLDASSAKVETTINQVDYTITSSNPTDKANVNFTFVSSSSLPIGQKMSAKISGQSITVTVNANEEFGSVDEINAELNKAIKAANGNVDHPAGEFTISMTPEASKFSALDIDGSTSQSVKLTGAQLVSSDFGFIPGEVTMDEGLKNLFTISSVGEGFKGDTRDTKFGDSISNTPQDVVMTYSAESGLSITAGEYSATISTEQLKSAGKVLMVKRNDEGEVEDSTDSYVLSFPSLATLRSSLGEIAAKNPDSTELDPSSQDELSKANAFSFTFNAGITKMTQSEPSRSLGLGQSSLKLAGGTEGGEQTVANLTSISINSEGIIVGTHEAFGVIELGRIDLATFSNPAGLQKVGSTYFETSLNSGDPIIVNAGTEGTGQIMASTLEASNVDLSNEFSDMIMTQRGFQASSRVITVSDTMLEELINLKR